jgi:hypothetical protein
MKITLSAAMRARDASRPQAGHDAAARAADEAAQAAPAPSGQQRPAPIAAKPENTAPAVKEPGPQPGGRPQQASGRPQQASGRRGGGQRAGRGRGRRRRHGR